MLLPSDIFFVISFSNSSSGNNSPILVYFSFVIISFLPPLVLSLVLTIKKVSYRLTLLIFLPAISLLIYYFFLRTSFEITSCTLLFAAYEMPLGDLYGIIYYSPVILSIYLLLKMVNNPIYKEKKINLLIMLWGLLLTFIPVGLIIVLFPFLLDYVESFFCKTAAIIAFTLTIYAMRNNNKAIEDRNE